MDSYQIMYKAFSDIPEIILQIYTLSENFCDKITQDRTVSNKEEFDSAFKNLLIHLFDCDIEPPLGNVPEFIKELMKNKS